METVAKSEHGIQGDAAALTFLSDYREDKCSVDFIYIATILLICIYGIQVCPFIENLNPLELLLTVSFIVGGQWAVRKPLLQKYVLLQPLCFQVKRRFALEWLLFAGGGLLLALFNTVEYGFPPGSGFKVLIGFVSLGYFCASEMALLHERELIHFLNNKNQNISDSNECFPMVNKFKFFSIMSICLPLLVVTLVMLKDIEWIVNLGVGSDLSAAKWSIFIEVFFVATILIVLILKNIDNFAMNLDLYLTLEREALATAALGNLNVRVAVASQDEFGEIARHTNHMIESLKQKNDELEYTQDITILSLASLAETRDNETGMHIRRTQHYVRALANNLRHLPEFKEELTDKNIELMYKSAPLHDIGKVGIPDAILLKPGKLTDDEFEIMKQHAHLGEQALEVAIGGGKRDSFLRYAQEIAGTHHEKWDGSGYPNGLAGDEIPLSGRLMAVADVYDALISKRVYKPAFSHEKAMGILLEGSGTHFDPRVVQALEALESEFVQIAKEFADKEV